MKVKQISIFLENKPGHLSRACRILREGGINIRTLTLADTSEFGILRLILRNWQEAQATLRDHGYTVTVSDVVAVELDDRSGSLVELLEVLDKAGVNIDYMYAFAMRNSERAVMVFRFTDPDRAIEALTAQNLDVLGSVDFFDRAEG